MTPSDLTRLDAQLYGLHLHYIQSHYQALATKAAEQQRSHLDYLQQLVEGEATMRENRSIERRIKNARFPVLKSLDDFQWNWPKKINRPQIQNLFRLAFISTQTNIVLIQAFSAEYITNILETRARALPEPGPLQLTRRHDLLDIDIAPPDLNAYEVNDHEP